VCGVYGKYSPDSIYFDFSELGNDEVSRVSKVSVVSMVSSLPTLFFSISLSLER
jgi:hypothetical protein